VTQCPEPIDTHSPFYIFTFVYSHATGIEDAFLCLLPHVPAEHFQAVGAYAVYLKTCLLIPQLISWGLVEDLGCRAPGHEDDMWVMVAAVKGGSVMSARLTVDIHSACGLCLGAGQRTNGFWPPPRETFPTYDGAEGLLAMGNMQAWPDFVAKEGKRERCVVFTREPFKRLMSMYTYALSAGEWGLKEEQKVLQTMSPEEGALWLWKKFGEETLLDTQTHVTNALGRGCQVIPMESLKHDFRGSMELLFNGWGVQESARLALHAILAKHDLNTKSEEELKKDAHVSSNKFPKEVIDAAASAFKSSDRVMQLIRTQRVELGYDAETGKLIS
jgi:hypothetical protein